MALPICVFLYCLLTGSMMYQTQADYYHDWIRLNSGNLGELRSEVEEINATLSQDQRRINMLEEFVARLDNTIRALGTRDCNNNRLEGLNGQALIQPNGYQTFEVYCHTEAGHTWTLLQRRVDASTSFDRDWADYKAGFGDVGANTNYWIGLERMYQLTKSDPYILRVTLEDWEGDAAYAEYSDFHLADDTNNYTLHYTRFLGGNAGDGLGEGNNDGCSRIKDQPFSTKDRDHDNNADNCAAVFPSGWWFNDCYHANLNGVYRTAPTSSQPWAGIQWWAWKESWHPLKRVSMMIRLAF